MPELPEVETVVRDLRPLLVGRRFAAVRVGQRKLRRPWKRAWAARLGRGHGGRRPPTRQVDRPRPGAGPRLVVHLGMTGQFTSPRPRPGSSATRIWSSTLDAGAELSCGSATPAGSAASSCSPTRRPCRRSWRTGSGRSRSELDPAAFREAVAADRRAPSRRSCSTKRSSPGSGTSTPTRRCTGPGCTRSGAARPLTARRGRPTARGGRDGDRAAIERRGSTIRDYVGGSGLRGGYQDEFRVYGRTGEPCPACATAIEVVRVAGRSSHYCPGCQKAVHHKRHEGHEEVTRSGRVVPSADLFVLCSFV